MWKALGDVAHYIEPFCGSCAVLLRRPHNPNRAYYSETVNDIDGFIANFWRAVTADPQAVAEACTEGWDGKPEQRKRAPAAPRTFVAIAALSANR